VKQGDVSLINKRQFDLLLANINRNILLKDISQFSSSLNDKGTLIVSGFYTQDLPIIKKVFEENKLKLDSFTSKNNWIAAIFRKQ
jgi:ribosomal protein L11 methyltransferase